MPDKKKQKKSKIGLDFLDSLETKNVFDPNGSGYDYETAKKYGIEPDSTGHWPSRVPETGQILKGKNHPTYSKTLAAEKELGYEITEGSDGRLYSKKTAGKSDLKLDFLDSLAEVATQDSSIPTDLKGIQLSEEEIAAFDQAMAKENVRIEEEKAKALEYEQEQPEMLSETASEMGITQLYRTAEELGVTQPVDTAIEGAKKIKKGKTGEGIADVVMGLIEGTALPFTVGTGLALKAAEGTAAEGTANKIMELLEVPFKAGEAMREEGGLGINPMTGGVMNFGQMADMGNESYNRLFDTGLGMLLFGGAMKAAGGAFRGAKGLGAKAAEAKIRAKAKARNVTEPTIPLKESDIAKAKVEVPKSDITKGEIKLPKDAAETTKILAEAEGKGKLPKDKEIKEPAKEIQKFPEDTPKPRQETKANLSKSELAKLKRDTQGQIAEGVTLNSKRLDKYKNEELGTAKVMAKLKEYGLTNEAVEIARTLTKGYKEIAKGSTMETVARVMLKNFEEMAIKKPVAPPKPISRVLVETPVKELPKGLQDKIIETAKELKRELNLGKIEQTKAYDSGRLKSTTINTFPDWYSGMKRKVAEVNAAFDKIIDGNITEKGILVETLKTEIFKRLAGDHVEASRSGTSGKFTRDIIGKIEPDYEFLDFFNRFDKDITLPELIKKYAEFEKEASFVPGVDFYNPKGKKGSKIKPIKNLAEYKKFKAELDKSKLNKETLTDILFELDSKRNKAKPSENPYLFRQTKDVGKKIGELTKKDVIVDAKNIYVDAKKINNQAEFVEALSKKAEAPKTKTEVKPETKAEEIKLTEEGARRKAEAEAIEREIANKKPKESQEMLELSQEGKKQQAKEQQTLSKEGIEIKLEPKDNKGEVTKASDIVRKMEKDLRIPIRFGKIASRALGIFKIRPEVVRLREAYDLAVASHEVAHYIDKRYNLRKTHLRRFSSELKKLDYDQTKQRNFEGFAEFVRHYLTMDDAAQVAPKFNKWFEEQLLGNDKFLDKFFKGNKKEITKWREQGSMARVISAMDLGTGTEKVEALERLGVLTRDQITKHVDALYPIKYAVDEIIAAHEARTGKKVKLLPSKDPRQLSSYLTKTSGAKTREYSLNGGYNFGLQKVYKGLKEITEPVSSTKPTERGHLPIHEALAYSYAKHGKTLWARGINPGISKADINYVLKNYKTKAYETFSKEFTQYSVTLLDYLLDAGVIDGAAKAAMIDANPFYIPLKRAFYDQKGRPGTAKGFVDQPDPLKRIKGSGRDIINPLESMVSMTEQIITSADKARLARSLADLANMEGAGIWIEKLKAPTKQTKMKLESLAEQLENLGADLTDADMEGLISIFSQGKQYYGRDNIVSVFRNGKREFYQLKDELYRTVKDLDKTTIPAWTEFLFGKTARAVRLGATGLRPGFALGTNPARDIQTFLLQNKHVGYRPDKVFMAIMEKFKGTSEYAAMFKRAGGEMAQPLGLDRRMIQNAVNEILANDFKSKAANIKAHPIEALKDVLSFTEAGPRLAEFEAVVKKYEPLIEKAMQEGNLQKAKRLREDMAVTAGNAANEVTVNFKRMGIYGQTLNQMIPFYNPAIQGKVNMIKTFVDNPTKAGLRAVSQLTAPTLALWNLHKDEEWYKGLPDWERYAFWHLKIGSTTITLEDGTTKEMPEILRIPKPFDWGYLFAGIPEAMANSIYTKDPKYFASAVKETAVSSLPDVIPATVKPLAEVFFNWDMFRERPLISQSLDRLVPSEQYTPFTSNFAIGVSQMAKKVGIRLAPISVDHLLSGYSGGLALDIIKGLPSEIKQKADIPVVGRFFTRKETLGINSKKVTEMYEAKDRAEEIYTTVQAKDKTDKPYEMTEEEEKYYNQHKDLMKAASDLKELRDFQKEIEASDMDSMLKEQFYQAINHAAYIVAEMATDFLRSEEEKKQRNKLIFPEFPKIPKK